MKNYLLIGIVIAVVLGALYFVPSKQPAQPANLGGTADAWVEIIGTRSGTTTTYSTINLKTAISTTTVANYIGQDVDTATYSFKSSIASSTGIVTYDIRGSNDGACETATTTTIFGDTVLTSDINWYQIQSGDEFFTMNNATGTAVTLTNLNWVCLQIQVSASTTNINVQMRPKRND